MLTQNIIELLARPDSFQADSIPPELEHFDFVPLLLSSLPISSAIIVLQGIQEAAHRLIANARDVSPPASLSLACMHCAWSACYWECALYMVECRESPMPGLA